MTSPQSPDPAEASRLRRGLLGLVAAGLLTRLLALPFATVDGGDPVAKIWIAQNWLSDPAFITHGVWGPLHTYILAVPLSLFSDPVTPPVVAHVLFGVATVIPLVLVTRIAFGSVSAALFAGAVYLFYPVAFGNSLLVSSEAPFVFFVALGLVGLARARGAEGRAAHAIGGGVALTLAGMLRYEGWMLIPLLSVVLWRKPRLAALFVGFALLHPVFWMAGNAVAHGDPLYSFHWASDFEMLRVGESLDLRGRAHRLFFHPVMTFFGMTPVAGGLAAAGAVVALRERREQALWLVPALALLALLSVSSAQGSLNLKAKYTVTVGTLLLPFAALLYDRFRLDDLRLRGIRVPVTLATVVLMLAFSHPEISPISPGYGFRPISLIPGFAGDGDARAIGESVRAELDSSDETLGFMTDGFPRPASHYITWLTRRDAADIYMPWRTNMDATPEERSDLEGELRDFLLRRPGGLLLFNRDSRFASASGLAASDTARLGRLRFTVSVERRFEYGDVELELARYAAWPSRSP